MTRYLIYSSNVADHRSRQMAIERGCGPITTHWLEVTSDNALKVRDGWEAALTAAEQAALSNTPDGDAYTYPAETGPTGLGDVPAPPFDLRTAIDGMSAGDTLELPAGVYQISSARLQIPAGISAAQKTKVRAAPGARVVVTCDTGIFPYFSHGHNVTVDGLWMVGQRTPGDGARRGTSLGNHIEMRNCIWCGSTDSMACGASNPVLLDGCMFMHTGEDPHYHGFYNSNSDATPEEHVTIQNTCFLSQIGGVGYLTQHYPCYSVFSRNFVEDIYRQSLTMPVQWQGAGHQIAGCVLWQGGITWSENTLPPTYAEYVPRVFENNLLCNWAGVPPENPYNDVIRNNTFINAAPVGNNATRASARAINALLGYSFAEINAAIAALRASFNGTVAEIYADATIDTNWAILKSAIANWNA